jgi:leader peptidase (prepilin peptidase)/N-methyltransferase
MTTWIAIMGFWFYIASVLVVIFVYDLKHYEIPDKVLIPAIIIAFIYMLIFPAQGGLALGWHFSGILSHLWAILIGAGFFFAIFFVSNGKWMGFGDVKFAVLMGLLLSFENTLLALFLAFFFGAIIGIISMIFKKTNLKSEIPFSPFLITGTLLAILWGPKIVNWYLNLMI